MTSAVVRAVVVSWSRFITGSWLVLAGVAAWIGGAPPAEAMQSIREAAPTRPLTEREGFERLLESSDLVLLARVISVEPTTRPLHPPSRPGLVRTPRSPELRRVTVEPVEWLRGGLDGDQVEIISMESMEVDTPNRTVPPETWRSVAGVDTVGVLLSLRRYAADWMLNPLPAIGMHGGLRIVSQRDFRRIRDSVLRASDGLTLDSLAIRADRIIVVAERATRPGDDVSGLVHVRVLRVLHGPPDPREVSVRPYGDFSVDSGDVLFLRSVGYGIDECVPFHRSGAPDLQTWTPSDSTLSDPESAVRAALKRAASN